ncbi:MAG: preprotein translocase subunit SecG [Bacteroidales bacterium]
MYTFLTICILIASILMIIVVLVQKSKGGGLDSSFSSANRIMGVAGTSNGIEKFTWTLAGVIMVLCIASAWFLPKEHTGLQQSEIINQVNEASQTDPALAAPGFNTPTQQGDSGTTK